MDIQLGRLERVDLRTAWQTEDGDFTNWLAQEENLALLGETLSLELECRGTEQGVGPFRADILCKDTLTDAWVLIENQLERTDHSHLGQLLTYAAGLEAVTIVWIARRFTDEHRAALDWLNEVTNERANFYGLEVELWRIEDSLPAPKFNVVSQPNEAVKRAATSRTTDSLTPWAQLCLDYWESFSETASTTSGPVRPRKARSESWYTVAIGRSNFWLAALLGPGKQINVQVNIGGPERRAYFHLLSAQKSEIESALGTGLEWLELPDKQICRIVLRKPDTDVESRSDWPAQHQWLLDWLTAFHRVFGPRVKQLDASHYRPDGEDNDTGSLGAEEADATEITDEDPNA